MAPGLNLLRRPRHHCINIHGSYNFYDSARRSALMADKEEEEDDDKIHEEGEVTTRSKVNGGWLQLGINVHGDPSGSHAAIKGTAGDLVELDFFGGAAPHDDDDTTRRWPTFPRAEFALPALGAGARCHRLEGRPVLPLLARLPPPATPSARVATLPPRTTQTGVWFLLQAAQHQRKEPFLPQLPKSYLRIKDGRMTISLLMKYLANKLVLEDESQVEITCRGQQLPPFMTLIYVRDHIWCSPEAVQLLSDSSSSTKYIMNLLYSRSSRLPPYNNNN